MKIKWSLLAGVIFSSLTVFAQHGHLNAGAAGTNQNDQLVWANGAIFAADSGFVRAMVYTNGGRFSNTYNQNISLTSLARTTNNGGPVLNAPALGAFVQAEIVSVEGPAGGAFQFWETNSAPGQPALNVPSGTSNGSFRFDLSDKAKGAGPSGGDPFGHIHSRRMAVTKPGLYTVGFRAVDVSTNGQGGGPIHAPSEVLEINFRSLTTLGGISKVGDLVNLSFRAEQDYHYDIEYTEDLSGTNRIWTSANVSISHSNAYLTLPVPGSANARRFYRLKSELEGHP